jgi:3-oxoadipate enol-lactonase
MIPHLHYEIAGDGHPLVLLHAELADSRMWDAQFAAFAAHYRVVRYDRRGMGGSPPPTTPFRHSDDLAALLDHLAIDSAHLVGCSEGGRVALEFAVAQPSRVRSLVLSAPSLRGYEFSDMITSYAEANDAALGAGELERAADLDMRMWVQGTKRRAETVDAAFRQRARDLLLDTYRQSYDAGLELPLEPPALNRLWQITAPSLVLVGEYDVPDFITIAGMVAFALDNAQKAMLSGAAHLLPMEQPAVFNAQVLAFLSGLSS